MGIKDLLPKIKSIQQKVHIKEFKGQRAAIDSYCWLHQGVYGMAHELKDNLQGVEYLVEYCINKLKLLLDYNIKPIFVFDGAEHPMKLKTEEKREKNRNRIMGEAKKLEEEGKVIEAMKKYNESVNITPKHAYALILALKKLEIEYIVAPYEADAQLAYLSLAGIVDFIITEDSDLLPFGASTVFMKMDKNGKGFRIDLADLKKVEEINMQSFDHTNFLEACILAGCDYLPSVKGIGVSKAFKLITNSGGDVKLAVQNMQKNKRLVVPDKYLETFDKAFLTFQYQVVYCPIEKKLRYLRDPEDSLHSKSLKDHEDLDFLGEIYDEELTQRVVAGDIDPITHEELSLDDAIKSAIVKRIAIIGQKKREKRSSSKRKRYNWRRKSKKGSANA